MIGPSGPAYTVTSSDPNTVAVEQVMNFWTAVAKAEGSAEITVSNQTGETGTLTLTVGPNAPQAPAAEDRPDQGEALDVRLELVRLVNEVRRENGVPELTVNEALMDAALKTFGRIDILVNNAGITKDGLLMMMKPEDFDAVIAANLRGTFLCMKAVARQMVKQRYGRIVNLSSVVGLRGNAGQVNYAASKAGVIGMTKSLAKELAGRNITVNAVAPGFIDTDMTAALTETAKNAALGSIPMGRMGTPENVAKAVAFLAGEDAGYITGQVLAVDGGMSM